MMFCGTCLLCQVSFKHSPRFSEFTIFIDNTFGIMSIIGIVHEHNGSEVWELLKSIIGKNENIIDSCLYKNYSLL